MSERIRELTDGTAAGTISLILETDLVPVAGVVQSRSPNIMRPDSETSILAESYSLNMKGVSAKDVSVKCANLIKLLRKAMNYKYTSWQRNLVYFQEKLSCESTTRYALCFGASGLNYDDLFNNITEFQNVITNIGITLVREHPWRLTKPGTLPAYKPFQSFDTVPAQEMEKFLLPNHNELGATTISHIYNYDASLIAWSGNLAGVGAHDIWSVLGAVPAAGDIYYIGSGVPMKHINIPIDVPGDYTADVVVEYGKGGGAPVWTALTDGVNFTRHPTGSEDALFKIADSTYILNINPPSDHALCTVNGSSRYWIRVRLNAVTAWVTTPVTQTTPDYLSSRPFVRTADNSSGDANPLSLLRIFSPTGGGTAPTMGTASRIFLAAKSGTLINSMLNLGNAYGAYVPTYGTDTAALANVQASGNYCAHCTFAVDATLIPRATINATNGLSLYRGRYKVFLRAQQIGGAEGDCRVQLRTMIGSNANGYPLLDSETIAMKSHDLGWELIDLFPRSYLNIPFAETEYVDNLTANLYFIIRAERTAGASVMYFNDLILIPIDEWFAELRDPISDVTYGGSALRGDTTLDLDGGVLSDRCIKYLGPGTGTALIPAEYWPRSGENFQHRPGTRMYLYALYAHYPTTFGVGPLIAPLGMGLLHKLYEVERYNIIGDP